MQFRSAGHHDLIERLGLRIVAWGSLIIRKAFKFLEIVDLDSIQYMLQSLMGDKHRQPFPKSPTRQYALRRLLQAVLRSLPLSPSSPLFDAGRVYPMLASGY